MSICMNNFANVLRKLPHGSSQYNTVGVAPPLQSLRISFFTSLFSSKGSSNESSLKPTTSASGGGDDTITMIMVVILFLACNTLALVVNVIETFFDPDPLLLNLLSDASNFLVILNSSVNCVIYFVFNKEYREIATTKFHRLANKVSRKTLCRVCCHCCHGSQHHRELMYQPVANGHDKRRPQSLRCIVTENNGDTGT
ncbi:hypothetical protein GCK32_014704, partial [Trichostrongylus colubriformis]